MVSLSEKLEGLGSKAMEISGVPLVAVRESPNCVAELVPISRASPAPLLAGSVAVMVKSLHAGKLNCWKLPVIAIDE